jgi:hypothetical protein
VALAALLASADRALAQPPHCDPTKTLTSAACARCHTAEFGVWRQTPHAGTIDTLHRNPAASEIARKLGASSVKRNDLCLDCHYTSQNQDGITRIIEGISCESCHGAGQDWVDVHSDYGGPGVTRGTEPAEHRSQRIERSIALGMRNPENLYLVARSCLQCHTVPNERLVNVGGHAAGSADFELVAWSQGIVRHNFLRSGNTTNAPSSPERLRVMYVVGLIADLEFSTRATASATERSTYGLAVAGRAAATALKLYEIQQVIRDPHVQQALEAFADAELKANNAAQLASIADAIAQAGLRFAAAADGGQLTAVDRWLPAPHQYK